jgi:hypothetical protein
LRTQSQREIEQAYRETYFHDKLTVRPTLESETNDLNELRVSPEQWDLSKLPPPKDKEYLLDDWLVVNYVMNLKTAEEWAELKVLTSGS